MIRTIRTAAERIAHDADGLRRRLRRDGLWSVDLLRRVAESPSTINNCSDR